MEFPVLPFVFSKSINVLSLTSGIIESYYHIVIIVSYLGHSIFFFETNSSQSNSWRCSCLDYLELEYTINTTSNDVQTFNVKNDSTRVLHVPILLKDGALTSIEDEVWYVTTYNDYGDIFILDISGGMYIGNVSCSVLLCTNSVDDIMCRRHCGDLERLYIYKLGRGGGEKVETLMTQCDQDKIYFYHLREQKVDTLMSSRQLNSKIRFIAYTNNLVMLYELKN
ncbi:hypothetical protein H5410_027217 [Solanum commersonii]|uniref:Uncharacterized protein n=1 Tax=Solanum commersonii TaxID=4109 RepID=A0A9J5Z0P0_SOLCO|nr:hypothetical protein H5410_027217 [Solanum commersonii]